jgi:hypothetical protein
MSAHNKCNCTTKTTMGNNKNMRVIERNSNYSHFVKPKGGYKWSAYSTLVCIGQDGNCPMNYRSKADGVRFIPNLDPNENHWYNRNTDRFKNQ